MNPVMWYLTRATGIVAVILMIAALVWGFFFSARATGTKLRPAWWLDLHNWLGGAALAFTGVHIVASWLDSNSGIGLVQIFVPGTAVDVWAITWGVVATYVLAAAVFTTWPRRLKNRRLWRVIHVASIGGSALALIHAYQSGSDAPTLAFRVLLVAGAGLATYGAGLRVFARAENRRAAT